MQDESIESLRDAITAAFPATVFQGMVTYSDSENWAEDIDDSLDLRDHLRGRHWSQIPAAIIDRHHNSVALLTDEAYPAFLAAWLSRSLDNLDAQNLVREYAIYGFLLDAPTLGNAQAAFEKYNLRRIGLLSKAQLAAVRLFLEFVKHHERNRHVREDAETALRNLDHV